MPSSRGSEKFPYIRTGCSRLRLFRRGFSHRCSVHDRRPDLKDGGILGKILERIKRFPDAVYVRFDMISGKPEHT